MSSEDCSVTLKPKRIRSGNTVKAPGIRKGFVSAGMIWNLDDGEETADHLRLLQDLRNRFKSSMHASSDQAKWTISEVESLIQLWNSDDQRFRVMGQAVFPEVFAKQSLTDYYDGHQAYKYMVARLGIVKFSPPTHATHIRMVINYHALHTTRTRTEQLTALDAFELAMIHECRKACWGVSFRIRETSENTIFWILPCQWTDVKLNNWSLDPDLDDPKERDEWSSLSDEFTGFRVNVLEAPQLPPLGPITKFCLQGDEPSKRKVERISGCFLVYVDKENPSSTLNPWVVLTPRQLGFMTEEPSVLDGYDFKHNRLSPSKFVELLRELHVKGQVSIHPDSIYGWTQYPDATETFRELRGGCQILREDPYTHTTYKCLQNTKLKT